MDEENEIIAEKVPRKPSNKTSMQSYWEKELLNMKTSKVYTGELNKYFMPKFFEYVLKN